MAKDSRGRPPEKELAGHSAKQLPPILTALHDARLKPTARIVKAYLIWKQGINLDSWTGIDRMARDLNISKNALLRGTDQLEKCGDLEVKRTAGGSRQVNHYRVKNCSISEQIWAPKLFRNGTRNCSKMEQKNCSETELRNCSETEQEHVNIEHVNRTRKYNAHSASARNFDPTFEKFWNLYPRKEGRDTAAAQWAKIPQEQHGEIYWAVEQHSNFNPKWREENGRFIPGPTRYLGEQRWREKLPPSDGGLIFGERTTEAQAIKLMNQMEKR